MKIATMKDVAKILPQLGYSPTTEKNIRAAINKCAKVYQCDLDRISADPSQFKKKWGTGRVLKVPKPFTTPTQFRDWRKRVRQVLARVHCSEARCPLPAEAAAILELVRSNQGKGKVLGPNSDISIGVALRVMADANLSLVAVDQKAVDALAVTLENNRRKSFKNGICGLNRLIDKRDFFPDADDLIPTAPLPLPADLRSTSSSWRRSTNNPAAAMIWQDFDEIMHKKQHGDDGLAVKGSPKEFSDNSVKAYAHTLDWFLRELASEDVLEDGSDLRDVLTYPNLVRAVNHWIAGRKERGLSAETSTLHVHVSRLVHIATAHLGVSAKEEVRMKELRKKPAIRTKSVGKMSVRREAWIRDFDRDPAKQELAHRLPEVLMRRAAALFDRERRGQKLRPSDKMIALRMGVAALQTAILFRASPIRATNMRMLRMRGDDAEFNVDGLMEPDWRLKELRLSIPGAQVKNGATIDTPTDDDLNPVVRWYLREIRPRLIDDHPYSKNHVDSDYLFPSTSDGPPDRTTFNDHFRRGTIEVGFDMEMHQARHVSGYWILSLDPNAWDEVAALLGDDEMTVRKFYGWLDDRRASDAGREKIRQQRQASNKHKRGDFADAA